MSRNRDRRRYPRHTALFSAKYSVKEGTFRDLISDIAVQGVFIRSRRIIQADQSITIRFPILAFEKSFQATGKVVRCDDEGFGVAFDLPIEERVCQKGQLPGILAQRERLN
jgi:hypothetical protein